MVNEEMKTKLKIYKFKVNRLLPDMVTRLREDKTILARSYAQAVTRLNVMVLDRVELVSQEKI